MPLNPRNTGHFHLPLFGDIAETVTLHKRGDDQMEGVVVTHRLFRCWWEAEESKSGHPVQGDMAVTHRRTLNVPKSELKRVGVNYLNVLDRFADKQGRVWQPETNQTFNFQLAGNYVQVECVRVA